MVPLQAVPQSLVSFEEEDPIGYLSPGDVPNFFLMTLRIFF